MTPLEELQAAHKRLSALRQVTASGPWSVGDRAPENWDRDDLAVVACENGTGDVTDYIDIADAHLIVTLHRTIDAQLLLLDDALDKAHSTIVPNDGYQMIDRIALALARSINGEAT